MTETLPTSDVAAHTVSSALRRRWPSVLLITLIVTAAVAGFLFVRGPSYTAHATVLLRPLTGNALSPDTATSSQSTTVAMQTEQNLVSSLPVTRLVNADVSLHLTPGTAHVSSSVPLNSQIVQVAYTASTRPLAKKLAQAYAEAFLAYRAQVADRTRTEQLDSLNAQAKTADDQLRQAYADAATKNPPADAQTKIRLYTSTLATLQSQIGTAQSISTDPGDVVSPAALPPALNVLKPVAFVGGALVGGLVLGVAVAVVRERLDDHIRVGAEAAIAGVPLLAAVGDRPRGRRDRRRGAARPGQRESFRRARLALLAIAPTNSVIAMAAVTQHVPTIDVATELARSLADSGYRVVLIDATDSTPAAAVLGMDPEPGLSDLLARDHLGAVTLGSVDGVQVLPAGSDPHSGAERYATPVMRGLLRRLRDRADYVLIATSSLTTTAGLGVVLVADAAVLVATENETTRNEIAEGDAAARRLGRDVLGLLVRLGPLHVPPPSTAAGREPAATATDGSEDAEPDEVAAGADRTEGDGADRDRGRGNRDAAGGDRSGGDRDGDRDAEAPEQPAVPISARRQRRTGVRS
jgi:Mrp family chromosome partitioning ATPase/capsular polysaccharide biosynthesis protein